MKRKLKKFRKAAEKPVKKKAVTRMKSSTSAMSIKQLEAEGFIAGKVEFWNHYCKRMTDLFGVIDIVAANPAKKIILGVQATSRENVMARVHKIAASADAAKWLMSGAKLEVWGWDKYKNRCRILKIAMSVSVRGRAMEKKRWTVCG
jgi:hypothetical protein